MEKRKNSKILLTSQQACFVCLRTSDEEEACEVGTVQEELPPERDMEIVTYNDIVEVKPQSEGWKN